MAKSGQRDPYQVLGVPRKADDDAIKKAYRKLAREHHPDVNPEDTRAEARFKEISEAYTVLSDTQKRRNYDEFGDISLRGGFDAEAVRRARDGFGSGFGAGPHGRGGFEEGGSSFGGLDDLFGELFTRRGWGGGPQRGADLEAELELEFLEAAQGGEKRISVTRPTADGGASTETVTVRIPAGMADGGRIRLAGKGAPGHGGAAGDLYARIRVQPHPVFRREGRDLLLEVPVTVREATLGAKIEIPTLSGRATVTIPPGTNSGKRLRLRGKGFPNPRGGPAGDLYATVQIRVPGGLDTAGRAALDEIARFDPDDPRKELFQ